MERTILYPFSITEDNSMSYIKTLELAKKMYAKVICLTTVQNEKKLDDAYLHLLNLNGYYHTNNNDWSNRKTIVEHMIIVGDMDSFLKKHLREESVDVLIWQSSISLFEKPGLEIWLNEINDGRSKVFNFDIDDIDSYSR